MLPGSKGMGIKKFLGVLVLVILMLPGGFFLWASYGDHPTPSDHPGSASVEFEDIQIDGGAHGRLVFKSNLVMETEDGYYVFNLERRAKDSFTGRVMVTERINENSPIKMDVMSAKGLFGDPEKTVWSVNHHLFTGRFKSEFNILDTIQYRFGDVLYHFKPYRPYHLIPGNEEIAGIVKTIEVGDRLKITGFDVSTFFVDAKNTNVRGFYLDRGCRTIIVTDISIS